MYVTLTVKSIFFQVMPDQNKNLEITQLIRHTS